MTKYLMVGGLLLAFARISPSPSYVDCRSGSILLFHANLSEGQGRKANVTVALSSQRRSKRDWSPRSSSHLAAEKRLIYRVLIFTGFFVLRTFLAHLSRLVTTRFTAKCQSKASILFSSSSRPLLALGIGCILRLG